MADPELATLLAALQTADRGTRQQAENFLAQVVQKGPEAQAKLLEGFAALATTGEPGLRSFAALLLRRYAMTFCGSGMTRVIDVVPAESRASIRQEALRGMTSDDTTLARDTRHKLADAVAELGRCPNSHSEAWNELLPSLAEASMSHNEDIRESVFRVLSAVPEVIDSSKQNHIDGAVSILRQGFSDPSDRVRVAATEAFTAFFRHLPKQAWKELKTLLPSVLRVMEPLRDDGRSTELQQVLESLIDLGEMAPKMFVSVFSEVIEFSLSVAGDRDLDEATRLSALEFATVFCDVAPNMCSQESSYAPKLVLSCLQLLMEVGMDDDDAAEWNNEDDVAVSEEDEEIHLAARSSLDRLALSLGGQVLGPALFHWLPDMVNSVDWRGRHGALMAISNVVEGCRDVLLDELNQLVEMVLPHLHDAHSRVQWAACNALGQMSTDLGPEIQQQYGTQILPALISKLTLESVPKVQAHAAAAVVNFSEDATQSVMERFMDDLLSHLLQLLSSPKRYVQEQVLTTIAIVADSAQGRFAKYYDTLMPLLLQVMRAPDERFEYRMLKAKAIECSTLIALAVGKQKLAPHLQQLVESFAAIQTSPIAEGDDDPCQPYLVQAWGRLCRTIGHDFLPYLDGVMPPLLQSAKARADCQLLDKEQAQAVDAQEGWEVVPMSGQYVSVHTAAFDEKQNALELLAVYASQLGKDFHPYVHEVVTDVVKPSLVFYWSVEVRCAAARLVPHLIAAEQQYSGAKASPDVIALWGSIFEPLLQLLAKGETPGMAAEFFRCIYQCSLLIDKDAIPPAFVPIIVRQVENQIVSLASILAEKGEIDDEFDEGSDDEDDDMDNEYLVETANEVIHAVFKTHRDQVLDAEGEHLIQLAGQFGVEGNPDDLRQWSLGVFCDLLEFCTSSPRFASGVGPLIVSALVSPAASVRENAAYAAGTAAMHGGSAYSEYALQSLQPLFQMVSGSQARQRGEISATETGIAAIAKILKRLGDQLGDKLDIAINEFIQTAFPVTIDTESAAFTYMFVVELVAKKHPAVFNNIPKVFLSVSESLYTGALSGKAAEATIVATKQLLGSLPEGKAFELLGSLSPEQQKFITELFS